MCRVAIYNRLWLAFPLVYPFPILEEDGDYGVDCLYFGLLTGVTLSIVMGHCPLMGGLSLPLFYCEIGIMSPTFTSGV